MPMNLNLQIFYTHSIVPTFPNCLKYKEILSYKQIICLYKKYFTYETFIFGIESKKWIRRSKGNNICIANGRKWIVLQR